MMDSTRKAPSSAKQQETRRVQDNRLAARKERVDRRSAVIRALMAGASLEQLSSLAGQEGLGIPNSVLLDMVSRERVFSEGEFRPLPASPPETAPYVWDSTSVPAPAPMEYSEGSALPPPLSASMPASPVSPSFSVGL